MPRQLRIEYEHATYHVMARGNRRESIYRDAADREAFLDRLGTVCQKTGWEVRAFVLMSNHYHLILHTPLPNLVEGMKWFQNAYTRYFNSRHRQWGRLFGDRYKSVLVEEERSFGGKGTAKPDYLATLIDYVHLNPARAGIVDPARGESLLDYPWSSLTRGYALAPGQRPKWLEVDTGLALAQTPDTAAGRRAYLRRLEGRMREEKAERLGLPSEEALPGQTLHSTLRRGWYWGSDAFREWLGDRLGVTPASNRTYRSSRQGKDHAEAMAERIIGKGREHFGIGPEEDLAVPVRGDLRRVAMAWAVWKRTALPQGWIAGRLGLRSAPNVSQWIKRFEGMEDRRLAPKIRSWRRNCHKFLTDLYIFHEASKLQTKLS